ncbi:hypothetical protein DSCO28_48520 [Desulfosarcina ovata subsp. sediminis]|uniref:Flagellar assembly protein T C-terminal domain-containing protein n=1 Tax=Desulfosarcina ovata subsp. sediminis TaxID=885957 RepID=A0A5K7ZVU0_9BACT|nr:FlgT C-terminal domain-containing protein [Desulfosarcina ovata]BBO84286.1 hypothetical protein DSCO28_48520 [Desulfosarcina ovata subsp. sediminis]
MIGATVKIRLLALLAIAALISGCGIAASYRPAETKSIRDFSAHDRYHKKVGVMALTNNTFFTSGQATTPFMEAFLTSMSENAPDAQMTIPGKTDIPPFLLNPPRINKGEMDAFKLAALARQEGFNMVVSPVLMDIRVRKENTGFWFFRDVAYHLQIQTAAAVYDSITGARLTLNLLTDEVDIDDQQAEAIKNGQEVMVEDLVEVVGEMGEELGEQMGEAINAAIWLSAIISTDDGTCLIPAGSQVGIQPGDRFSVLQGGEILTGLGDQRYIVPGLKIGEIRISQVAPRQSSATVDTDNLPPVGSIVVPGT